MTLQAPPSAREDEPGARLRAYGVLDPAQPLPALDELVKRAQDVGAFPMAWLSFFDGKRERLRARAGVSFAYLPREQSFAFAAEPAPAPVFIEDVAATDLATHPLVASGPRVRFVGVLPLAAPDGCVVGTLTVLDVSPRRIGKAERTALANIASIAMARLEARRESGRAAAVASDGLTHGQRTLAERLEDATRRRRSAEESLEREKEFSEAVLDSLAGAFFLVSSDGVILRWNAALSAAIGYTGAEIGTMNPLDFVSPRDREHVESAMREVFEQGREMALEAEIVDRAGNVRPYALSGKPLRVGERTYLIGVARDITLRKRTQEEARGGPRRVPRDARSAHGASQSRAAARPPRAGRLQRRAPPHRLRVHVHRPGPVQDHQRLPRPPGGRRAAETRRGAPHGVRARDRYRGAPGRRRVRGDPGEPRGRRRRGRPAAGREDDRRHGRADADRQPAPLHVVLDRHQPLSQRRQGQRRAHEERRRRHVLRQGERAQQLPVLLPGDELARAGAALRGELPAPRLETKRAPAALPAAREDVDRRAGGCRGADPLAASAPGLAHARPVHRGRRGF